MNSNSGEEVKRTFKILRCLACYSEEEAAHLPHLASVVMRAILNSSATSLCLTTRISTANCLLQRAGSSHRSLWEQLYRYRLLFNECLRQVLTTFQDTSAAISRTTSAAEPLRILGYPGCTVYEQNVCMTSSNIEATNLFAIHERTSKRTPLLSIFD